MALWTNLVKQSANLSDATSPWGSVASAFTVTAAPSIIPGQTAYRHENTGAGTSRNRAQVVGTLSDGPETFVIVLENIDAVETFFAIRDQTAAAFVARVDYNWGTGDIDEVDSPAGTGLTFAAGDAVTGPSGGELRRLDLTVTPDNPGNSRAVFLYVTGPSTNTLASIVHAAGLFEAATYAPAYLVNGASVSEQRVIDLSAYKLSSRPTERRIDLDHKRRRASGKMSTTLHSDGVRSRVWGFETEIDDRTEGEALQAELEEPGTIHVVHNPLIHAVTGVAAEVECSSVRRLDGPMEDDVRLAMEFAEVRAL